MGVQALELFLKISNYKLTDLKSKMRYILALHTPFRFDLTTENLQESEVWFLGEEVGSFFRPV